MTARINFWNAKHHNGVNLKNFWDILNWANFLYVWLNYGTRCFKLFLKTIQVLLLERRVKGRETKENYHFIKLKNMLVVQMNFENNLRHNCIRFAFVKNIQELETYQLVNDLFIQENAFPFLPEAYYQFSQQDIEDYMDVLLTCLEVQTTAINLRTNFEMNAVCRAGLIHVLEHNDQVVTKFKISAVSQVRPSQKPGNKAEPSLLVEIFSYSK